MTVDFGPVTQRLWPQLLSRPMESPACRLQRSRSLGKGGGCIVLHTAELHGLLLRSGMFISTTMAQFLAKKSWKSQAGPP